MQVKVVNLLALGVLAGLTGCGTEELHYTDTQFLERPPAIASTQSPELETSSIDDSVVSSADDNKIGMGERVQFNDANPALLTIKQPLPSAWKTVYQALKQKDLKMTDHDKDKAVYYVSYDKSSLLDRMGALFKSSDTPAIYMISLKEAGEFTEVTAALAGNAEQKDFRSPDGVSEDSSVDYSTELLKLLYETMRDELVKS